MSHLHLAVSIALFYTATLASAGTVCNSNFFLNAENKCQRCTYTRCEIGSYRQRCNMGSTADAECTPCTNEIPENAVYSTFGMPYLFNNCRWRCADGFFLEADNKCTACSTESCPNNQIRESCMPYSQIDTRCICRANEFLDTETDSCKPCSTEACPDGTTRQTCDGTSSLDAQCV